jgi:hypothetical protein
VSKDHSVEHEESLHSGTKRIVPRYPFEARFKIRIDRSGRILETEGWARDLSESGLGAFVAAAIFVGETATLRIPLPDGHELVVPAKVTRKSGTQYGFRFTALSSQQRSEILRAFAGRKAIPFNPASV